MHCFAREDLRPPEALHAVVTMEEKEEGAAQDCQEEEGAQDFRSRHGIKVHRASPGRFDLNQTRADLFVASGQAAFLAQRSRSSQPPMCSPFTKTCGTVPLPVTAPTIRLRLALGSETSE